MESEYGQEEKEKERNNNAYGNKADVTTSAVIFFHLLILKAENIHDLINTSTLFIEKCITCFELKDNAAFFSLRHHLVGSAFFALDIT
jgi:hypothetical protein